MQTPAFAMQMYCMPGSATYRARMKSDAAQRWHGLACAGKPAAVKGPSALKEGALL